MPTSDLRNVCLAQLLQASQAHNQRKVCLVWSREREDGGALKVRMMCVCVCVVSIWKSKRASEGQFSSLPLEIQGLN